MVIQIEESLWTWLRPDEPRNTDRDEWRAHGGKWIVFDRLAKTESLAETLGPWIDRAEIESAKFWRKDPSALCVYTHDNRKAEVWEILRAAGAGNQRVWEYDFAWGKNLRNPVDFTYSQASKLRTILRSYGCRGAWQLLRGQRTPSEGGTQTGTQI
jgi:hypothetical protein